MIINPYRIDRTVGLHSGARANLGVAKNTARPNRDTITQDDTALKHAVNIDKYILAHAQLTANVHTSGVSNACAGAHDRVYLCFLVAPLKLRQLHTVIHSLHFIHFSGLISINMHTFRGRHFNNISEVVFTLSVVTGESRQPAFQLLAGGGQNARITFCNPPLRFAGVLLFDNTDHSAFSIALDATVALWIIKHHG